MSQGFLHPQNDDPGEAGDPVGWLCGGVSVCKREAHFVVQRHRRCLSGARFQDNLGEAALLAEVNGGLGQSGSEARAATRRWHNHAKQLAVSLSTTGLCFTRHGHHAHTLRPPVHLCVRHKEAVIGIAEVAALDVLHVSA